LISRTFLLEKVRTRNAEIKQICSCFFSFSSLLSIDLKKIYNSKINYFSKRISTVHKTRCETW